MRVLLHICCGPCAIMPIRELQRAGHDVAGWFYNPNIHPLAEYLRRREGAAQVAGAHGIPLYFPASVRPDTALSGTAVPDAALPTAAGRAASVTAAPGTSSSGIVQCRTIQQNTTSTRKPERENSAGKAEYDVTAWCKTALAYEGGRCLYCRESRFDAVAKAAYAMGFDAFTSSLLYSRHQNHEGMRAAGERAAATYGVPFLYQDFRPFWQAGITASKELGIYRQQYCGCVFSEEERYARDLEKTVSGVQGGIPPQ